MTNPNDPAFPKLPINQLDQGISWPGLTKREFFAAMVIQGLLGGQIPCGKDPDENCAMVAEAACNIADVLIAELNKEGLERR